MQFQALNVVFNFLKYFPSIWRVLKIIYLFSFWPVEVGYQLLGRKKDHLKLIIVFSLWTGSSTTLADRTFLFFVFGRPYGWTFSTAENFNFLAFVSAPVRRTLLFFSYSFFLFNYSTLWHFPGVSNSCMAIGMATGPYAKHGSARPDIFSIIRLYF